MKKHENLAGLFEQTSAVENRHMKAASKIDKEDLIVMILDTALAEYQAVLTSEQKSKGASLKQYDLEDAMNRHWHQLNKNKAATDEKEPELMLIAITRYECNEEGHKANKCRKTCMGRGGCGQGRGGRGGR
jgi:hypothetical protein